MKYFAESDVFLTAQLFFVSSRADCCHQLAKITAVDMAGNVGLCNVTINPGFVVPDPKLCSKHFAQTQVLSFVLFLTFIRIFKSVLSRIFI